MNMNHLPAAFDIPIPSHPVQYSQISHDEDVSDPKEENQVLFHSPSALEHGRSDLFLDRDG